MFSIEEMKPYPKELMKSGIYEILLPNDWIYIGSGVNIKGRVYSHKNKLIKKIHNNRILQRLYNKHGFSNWFIKIIEEVDKNNLIKREAYHLNLAKKKNKKLANLTGVTGTNLGLRRNKESRLIMSLAAKNRSKEDNANIEKARQKVRNTKAFKLKISASSKKMWQNPESIKKLLRRPVLEGENHPMARPIRIINSDYIFASALQAQKILQAININVDNSLIGDVAKGNRKHHAFLEWQYVTESDYKLTKELKSNDEKIIINLQQTYKTKWEQFAYKGINNKNSRPILCKELDLCFLSCTYAKDFLETKYNTHINSGSLYSAAKRGNKFKGYYWLLLDK